MKLKWICIALVTVVVCGCVPMEYAVTGILGNALQDIITSVLASLPA